MRGFLKLDSILVGCQLINNVRFSIKGADTDLAVPPVPADLAIGEKFKRAAFVEQIAGKSSVLSERVAVSFRCDRKKVSALCDRAWLNLA